MVDLEPLAQGILNFVNWGITIITIMAIWEFIAWATGYGTEGKKGGGFGKGLTDWEKSPILNKLGLTTGAKEEKKIKRKAARSKTQMLNDFVEEKKELGLLNDSMAKLKTMEAEVNGAKSSGITNKDTFPNTFANLKTAVGNAQSELSKLTRATFRQERRTKQLIDELEDMGTSKSKIQEARSLESSILERHEQVIKNVDAAANFINKGAMAADAVTIAKFIQSWVKNKKKFPIIGTEVIGKDKLQDRLDRVGVELAAVNKALTTALSAQKNAYTSVESLVAMFRDIWEK